MAALYHKGLLLLHYIDEMEKQNKKFKDATNVKIPIEIEELDKENKLFEDSSNVNIEIDTSSKSNVIQD